ncbi:hypothetical protein TURU_090824 [Turdus rufiventris]|nr:hypothetical protein TURU_090824 [Turdus rufiventris]
MPLEYQQQGFQSHSTKTGREIQGNPRKSTGSDSGTDHGAWIPGIDLEKLHPHQAQFHVPSPFPAGSKGFPHLVGGQGEILERPQEFQELDVGEEAELHDSLAVELVLALVLEHVEHGELGVESGQDQRQDQAGALLETGKEGKKNGIFQGNPWGYSQTQPASCGRGVFEVFLFFVLPSLARLGCGGHKLIQEISREFTGKNPGAPGDLQTHQEKPGAPGELQEIHWGKPGAPGDLQTHQEKHGATGDLQEIHSREKPGVPRDLQTHQEEKHGATGDLWIPREKPGAAGDLQEIHWEKTLELQENFGFPKKNPEIQEISRVTRKKNLEHQEISRKFIGKKALELQDISTVPGKNLEHQRPIPSWFFQDFPME